MDWCWPASSEYLQQLITMLREKGLRVATAESCTGGLLAGSITAIPGSSEVFDCGIVSYSNTIKHQLLGVEQMTLDTVGAVSEETARQMAIGVRRLAAADIALSTTGIAGPGGATADKPVGLVYIALATEDGCWVKRNIFQGNRAQVRQQTVETALSLLETYLNNQ